MAEKKAIPKKKTTTRKVNKGDSLVCEVCGLTLAVEQVGNIAFVEENALLCCGKPLTKKATKTKTKK